MKLVTTDDGQTFGPFQTAKTLGDRIVADGLEFPFTALKNPKVVDLPRGYESPPPPPPTLAEYIAAMEAHYDAKAQERRYDGRLTCALRAGYAGPFQAEGAAFAIWMDTCNALGYQMMAEVQVGTRAVPTIAELITALPALTWPA